MYQDLGVDILVSWLLSHGHRLGHDGGELDMNHITIGPGERHHHCLARTRSCQRGYRGGGRGRLQSLVIIVAGGGLRGAWSVSLSGVRLAGACRATIGIITVFLKNPIFN